MTARTWKRIVWALAILQIVTAIAFVAFVGATPEEWRAARPLAIATSLLAWASFFAGERYRVMLWREPWPPKVPR